MSAQYSVGIDIGTYHIKVAIVEQASSQKSGPKIVGTGFAESKGMRYGYIISTEEVRESLKKAVASHWRRITRLGCRKRVSYRLTR